MGGSLSTDYVNTLLSHASAISSVGRAHTDFASQHRRAAAALRSGRRRSLTLDSHFRGWLLLAVELAAAAERIVALEVELARTHGVTWDEVGQAFGISRQAAWDRFARHSRWNKARPVVALQRSQGAHGKRELELAKRKAELLAQLTDGDYTEQDLAALERVLGIASR